MHQSLPITWVLNWIKTQLFNANDHPGSLFFFFFFVNLYGIQRFFFYINLACSNDKYGGDCEYSCGHCYNNAYCDRTGGTCSNGCKRGYRGSDCKQRKCFYFFHESNDIVEWKNLINVVFFIKLFFEIFYWLVVNI